MSLSEVLRETLLEFKPSQWDEALHECVKAKVETEWALARDSTTTTITTTTTTTTATPSYGWDVTAGPCNLEPNTMCITSPNYPSRYQDNLDCTFAVQQPYLGAVSAVSFNTERGWDYLLINGVEFHGSSYNSPTSVTPNTGNSIVGIR